MKLSDFIINSRKSHKVMRTDTEKSTLSAEKAKKVLESRLLSDMTGENGFAFSGHGSLESSEAGLKLTCPNTLAEFAMKRLGPPMGRREAPQREPNYGRSTLTYRVGGEDWSAYDRITFTVRPDCRGYQSVWLELTLVSGENEAKKRVNLQNGKSNTVIWAFGDVERSEVSAFAISYVLQGAQMNMADKAVFCFNKLTLEKIEPTVPTPVKVELTTEKLKELAWKTLNYYYSQRCGYDIPTVHLPCHEDCFAKHPDGRLAPISGGWHGEGYSHSLFATASSASALMALAEKVRDDEALYLRLMEEARVGLEWMLRTRFADGYRCVNAPIDIYTRGIIGDADDLKLPAHNDPHANFVCAKVEAEAAIAYASLDPTFAGYAGRCAEADFEFAYERMNLGGRRFDKFEDTPEEQLYESAVGAANALCLSTKKDCYREKADAWTDKCPTAEKECPEARLKYLLGENPDGISYMVGEGERWATPFSYFGSDIVGALGDRSSIGGSAELLELIAKLI